MQGTFGSGGEVVFNLRIDTTQASTDVHSLMENFNKLEAVALRYISIARNMGLPDNVQESINLMTRAIVIMRQAQMTMHLLQLEMGPIGWAMFIASGTLTMISAADMGYDVMRGT